MNSVLVRLLRNEYCNYNASATEFLTRVGVISVIVRATLSP
jgi:hypothetical protein